MKTEKLTWKTMSGIQKAIIIFAGIFLISLFIPKENNTNQSTSENKSVFKNCMETKSLQNIEYAVRRDFCKCMRNKISDGYTGPTARDKCAYTLL